MSVPIRNILQSKFRGALTGGLIGDCLGAPFEGEAFVSYPRVNIYLSQLFDPKIRVPYKPYTDDTVMTKGVAESLIQHNGINPIELAKRFTTDYFQEPKRGYGASIHDVFVNFRMNGFEDPFYPARKQFGGQGSYGNGAAMRSTPCGLFMIHDSIENLQSLTTTMSKITHAHPLAIQGAILQALAVREAILLNPDQEINPEVYIDNLIKYMGAYERESKANNTFDEPLPSYIPKLKTISKFLKEKNPPPVESVQNELGVEVEAIHSIPTAIYAFLLSRKQIKELECDDKFLRSIAYSISLGGDTDTIGSMAGSLSGAFYGYEAIPQILLKHTENPDEIFKIADQLYDHVVAKTTEEKVENVAK